MITVLHETDLRKVGLGRSGWTLKLEAFVFPFRKRQEEVEQKLPPSSFCPVAAAAIILRNLSSSSSFSSFSCPFNSIHVHFSPLLPPLLSSPRISRCRLRSASSLFSFDRPTLRHFPLSRTNQSRKKFHKKSLLYLEIFPKGKKPTSSIKQQNRPDLEKENTAR